MTEAEWCKRCRDASNAHARRAPNGPTALRDVLAELDSLMRCAPWAIRSSYTRIPEADLAEGATRHAASIESGSLAWPHFPLGAQKALTALAIQIRSVDAVLKILDPRYNRLPSDPARDWISSDGQTFVIPSRRRRDLGSSAGDKLGYGRRGTMFHRIIPASLDGMRVRPIALAALDAKAEGEVVRLGSAIFPGLVVARPQTSEDGFVVKAVQHPDLAGAITRQASSLAAAHAIVWPELTIDDDSLAVIMAELGRLAMAHPEMPNVVVAGSWHRGPKGARRNLAPILDGVGDLKGDYSKVALFANDEGLWEDVKQGDELLVLVCDRFLASIAICKDYCDLGVDPPWHLLDVDLLLVPSMGGATTMAGHLSRSTQDRISHDLRPFVVQQGTAKNAGAPAGYVLPAPRTPPQSVDELRLDAEWRMDEI